jgi:hypothetical protein
MIPVDEQVSGAILFEALQQNHIGHNGPPPAVTPSALTAYENVRRLNQLRFRSPNLGTPAETTALREASIIQQVWWNRRQDPRHAERLFVSALLRDTNPSVVEGLVQNLIERHPVLASKFEEDGDRLLIRLNETSKFRVENGPFFTSLREAIAYIGRWRTEPIPNDSEWLLRATTAQLGSSAIVAMNLNHLICDGRSVALLADDIRKLNGRAGDQTAGGPSPERDFRFFEYAAAERHWMGSEAASQLRRYWEHRLDSLPPFCTPGGTLIGGRVARPKRRFTLEMTSSLVDALEIFARESRVSLYTVFLAAYALTLSEWSGNDSFPILSICDGRFTPRMQSAVGFITSSRPVEVSFSGEKDMPTAVRHVALQDNFSRSIPLPLPQQRCEIRHNLPIFLNYDVQGRRPGGGRVNGGDKSAASVAECRVRGPVDLEFAWPSHPISLTLNDTPQGGMVGQLDFSGLAISEREMVAFAAILSRHIENSRVFG